MYKNQGLCQNMTKVDNPGKFCFMADKHYVENLKRKHST